jgi:hypothetical protein
VLGFWVFPLSLCLARSRSRRDDDDRVGRGERRREEVRERAVGSDLEKSRIGASSRRPLATDLRRPFRARGAMAWAGLGRA